MRGKEKAMSRSILWTNGAGRFGLLASLVLAKAGHKVYAALRHFGGPSHNERAETAHSVLDGRTLELDILSPSSIDVMLDGVGDEVERLEIIIHSSSYLIL